MKLLLVFILAGLLSLKTSAAVLIFKGSIKGKTIPVASDVTSGSAYLLYDTLSREFKTILYYRLNGQKIRQTDQAGVFQVFAGSIPSAHSATVLSRVEAIENPPLTYHYTFHLRGTDSTITINQSGTTLRFPSALSGRETIGSDFGGTVRFRELQYSLRYQNALTSEANGGGKSLAAVAGEIHEALNAQGYLDLN